MKILWTLDKYITSQQLSDLIWIYRNVEIAPNHSSTAKEIIQASETFECSVIAVDNPSNVLNELLKEDSVKSKVIIRPKKVFIPVGTRFNPDTRKKEKIYTLQYSGWEQVIDVGLVTKPLL